MTRRKLRRARIARNAWARLAHRTLTHLDGEPAEPTSVLRDLYPAEVWGASYMPTRGPERRRISRRWGEVYGLDEAMYALRFARGLR